MKIAHIPQSKEEKREKKVEDNFNYGKKEKDKILCASY